VTVYYQKAEPLTRTPNLVLILLYHPKSGCYLCSFENVDINN